MTRFGLACALLAAPLAAAPGQNAHTRDAETYSHADTLRGSQRPARAWWDVDLLRPARRDQPGRQQHPRLQRHHLPRPAARAGDADRPAGPARGGQHRAGRPARSRFRRDGNAFFVTLAAPQRAGRRARRSPSTTTASRASPRRPPWDGGFTWARDSLGNRWIVTTDEGLGASVWWPNKDTLADEPDSQRIAHHRARPDDRRLQRAAAQHDAQRRRHHHLRVVRHRTRSTTTTSRSNAGHVRALQRHVRRARRGKLTLDFWPLAYHLDAARRQFPQATPMLQLLRALVRPVPVVRGRLQARRGRRTSGMEHQSAVAYGNRLPERLPRPRPARAPASG